MAMAEEASAYAGFCAFDAKNFGPTMRIMANGEVGICPLMHGKEAYGNIHQRELSDILNSLQDSVLFKLHAENKIARFFNELDSAEFKDGFDHLCSVRIAVNHLALSQELESN
jgi:hypothetical protein